MRTTKTISRRYYKNRLWKITYTLTDGGSRCRGGYRLCKFYERRNSVGGAWALVNSAVQVAAQ